jgi:MSHA biogenesis protein MshN
VSIINKMLQELDRRHARPSPQGQAPHPDVRTVASSRSGHEWFWRSVAALMLVAAGWTLWVVYQLQPRSVATELAYRAVENTRKRSTVTPAPAPAAEPVAVATPVAAAAAATPVPEAPKPVPEKLAAPIETLRLAMTIDTPLAPRARQVARAETAKVAAEHKPAPARPAKVNRQTDAGPTSVEKRDRSVLPSDRAEAEYRRAASLLNTGRVADAEEALLASLKASPAHQAARQTLIVLYLEQRRLDEARRHLQEGVAFNPTYAPFALALARIHVDQRDGIVALDVLDRAGGAGQGSADFHALRGAILQRLARHAEAADAYRQALSSGAQSGTSWVGLGISLEALERRPEAAEAFRRGIATGTLGGDLLAYAEQRAQQLR